MDIVKRKGVRFSLEKRLMSKVHKDKSGCWIWTGALTDGGYGFISYRTSSTMTHWRTHRLSYELFVGEIPDGIQVCHTCDIRTCINPKHLFLGTQKQNVQDAIKKGRFPSKLSVDNVLRIRSLYATEHYTYRYLAAKFGMSISGIGAVVRNESWVHA